MLNDDLFNLSSGDQSCYENKREAPWKPPMQTMLKGWEILNKMENAFKK